MLKPSDNEKLLKETWFIRRARNTTYYIKSIFEENEYFMLITDLRQVWFEHGDYKRIQQNAILPNIDIETAAEAAALLKRVQKLFRDSTHVCDIQETGNQLDIVCDGNKTQRNTKINTLCWIFHCELYEQSAQLIFEHFIQPSQAIINYFTDNLSEDANVQIKLANTTSSMYSTTSLSFISDVLNDKKSIKRKPIPKEPLKEDILPIKEMKEMVLTKEELEEKHKEDLKRLAEEERQRNPNATKKKRRKL